jgi:hypothetical protein
MNVTSTGIWDATPCNLMRNFTCFSCSEAGGCIFLRNFGACLPNNTVSHPPHKWTSNSLKAWHDRSVKVRDTSRIPHTKEGRTARLGDKSRCEQFEESRGYFYKRIIERKKKDGLAWRTWRSARCCLDDKIDIIVLINLLRFVEAWVEPIASNVNECTVAFVLKAEGGLPHAKQLQRPPSETLDFPPSTHLIIY